MNNLNDVKFPFSKHSAAIIFSTLNKSEFKSVGKIEDVCIVFIFKGSLNHRELKSMPDSAAAEIFLKSF